MREAVQHRGMFNIIHNASLVKIDFILRKEDPYRKTEFSRRRQVSLGGGHLWIASLEDLIISKLAWTRDLPSDRQLDDVKNLLQNRSALDVRYLDEWIEALDLKSIYGKAAP